MPGQTVSTVQLPTQARLMDAIIRLLIKHENSVLDRATIACLIVYSTRLCTVNIELYLILGSSFHSQDLLEFYIGLGAS